MGKALATLHILSALSNVSWSGLFPGRPVSKVGRVILTHYIRPGLLSAGVSTQPDQINDSKPMVVNTGQKFPLVSGPRDTSPLCNMKYLVLRLGTLALLASTMAQNSTIGPTTDKQNSTIGPTTNKQNSTIGPTTDKQNFTIGPTTDQQNSTTGPTTDQQNSTTGPAATTTATTAIWPSTPNSTKGPTTDQQNSTTGPTTDQQNSTTGPTTDQQNSTTGPTTDQQNSTKGPTSATTIATWLTTLTTPAGGSHVFSYSMTLLFGSTASLIMHSLWQ